MCNFVLNHTSAVSCHSTEVFLFLGLWLNHPCGVWFPNCIRKYSLFTVWDPIFHLFLRSAKKNFSIEWKWIKIFFFICLNKISTSLYSKNEIKSKTSIKMLRISIERKNFGQICRSSIWNLIGHKLLRHIFLINSKFSIASDRYSSKLHFYGKQIQRNHHNIVIVGHRTYGQLL